MKDILGKMRVFLDELNDWQKERDFLLPPNYQVIHKLSRLGNHVVLRWYVDQLRELIRNDPALDKPS